MSLHTSRYLRMRYGLDHSSVCFDTDHYDGVDFCGKHGIVFVRTLGMSPGLPFPKEETMRLISTLVIGAAVAVAPTFVSSPVHDSGAFAQMGGKKKTAKPPSKPKPKKTYAECQQEAIDLGGMGRGMGGLMRRCLGG